MSDQIVCEDSHFSVRVNASQRRIDLALLGFWDVSVVRRFSEAAQRASDILGTDVRSIHKDGVLIDNTAFQVQGKEVVDALTTMVAEEAHPRRTAVIVQSSLLRRQAQRVGPEHRMFDTREAAIAWLEAGDVSA